MPKRRLTDAEKRAAIEKARSGAPAKVEYKVDDETDEKESRLSVGAG